MMMAKKSPICLVPPVWLVYLYQGTDKAVTAGRRKEHYTPTSTSRIRSRTNDAATVGTPRGASSASRALAPRRATWGGDGLAGLEVLPVENAKRGSAMEAWRSKSEGAGGGLRGGDAEDERAVETPRRACKDAVSSSAAGDGKADLGAEAKTEADVALEPFFAWEQNVADARQPAGENWDHGDGQASEEEYIAMEDRLEAVMKDLGVPLGDEREPKERNLTPPPRETHGAGVADGGDCQLPFGALRSTGTAAAVVPTRGGSTEAAGGEGGGEVITPSGRRDDGVSAGVRTVRQLPQDGYRVLCFRVLMPWLFALNPALPLKCWRKFGRCLLLCRRHAGDVLVR